MIININLKSKKEMGNERKIKVLNYLKEGDLTVFEKGKKFLIKNDEELVEITISEVFKPGESDLILKNGIPKNIKDVLSLVQKLITDENFWVIKGITNRNSSVVIIFLENFQLYIAEAEKTGELFMTIQNS